MDFDTSENISLIIIFKPIWSTFFFKKNQTFLSWVEAVIVEGSEYVDTEMESWKLFMQ